MRRQIDGIERVTVVLDDGGRLELAPEHGRLYTFEADGDWPQRWALDVSGEGRPDGVTAALDRREQAQRKAGR